MFSAQSKKIDEVGYNSYPAFNSQPAFLGAKWGNGEGIGLTEGNKKLALVGIPYDGATTNRPGARFGPRAIREASLMLCDAIHPLFAITPTPHLVDYGDLIMPTTNHQKACEAIESGLLPFFKVDTAKNNTHLCVIGGDHSITLSMIRLHAKKLGKPLALVHFDAHCDTWEDHFSEPSGHGTWVHEALSEGLIDSKKTVQIGLRSSGEPAVLNYIANRGGIIQDAHSLRGLEGVNLLPNIKAIIDRIGNEPVYLTVDIDCLDPVYAPGTGTPEPAGMTSTQLSTYLESLPLNWQGMDCVEVAPAYDHAQLTAQMGAHIVWTYMCAYLKNLYDDNNLN